MTTPLEAGRHDAAGETELDLRPLTARIGAEVRDLDLAGELDSETFEAVHRAPLAHHVHVPDIVSCPGVAGAWPFSSQSTTLDPEWSALPSRPLAPRPRRRSVAYG